MSDSKPSGPTTVVTAFKHLEIKVDALTAKMDKLIAHLGADRQATSGATGGGTIATVAQIKGERGDPKMGKPPKNWDGPSFEGCAASQCTPDFLDFYADFLDWKANNPRNEKDEKYAGYNRLDAARCRRWAIEIREGRVRLQETPRAPPPPPQDDGYDDNLPPTDDAGPPPNDDDNPF